MGFVLIWPRILGRDQYSAGKSAVIRTKWLLTRFWQKCKLIAEAWDAGGSYQVGAFLAYGRWAEWNGRYRDTIRRFLKGDPGQVAEMMQRVMGSPDLYAGRGASASINFITCHDGFTSMIWYPITRNIMKLTANKTVTEPFRMTVGTTA